MKGDAVQLEEKKRLDRERISLLEKSLSLSPAVSFVMSDIAPSVIESVTCAIERDSMGKGNQGLLLPVRSSKWEGLRALKVFLSVGDAEKEYEVLKAFPDCRVIPKVYGAVGFVEIADGTYPAIMMEYIGGAPLCQLIQEDRGFLPPVKAIESLFPALKFSSIASDPHTSRSVRVHRDMKPANLLLDDQEGFVRLVDFGKSTASFKDGAHEERNGSSMYIPPCARGVFEGQGLGDPGDPRVDTYSFGALLLVMTQGERALWRADEGEGSQVDPQGFLYSDDTSSGGVGGLKSEDDELSRFAKGKFMARVQAKFPYIPAEECDRSLSNALAQFNVNIAHIIDKCLCLQGDRYTPSTLSLVLSRMADYDQASDWVAEKAESLLVSERANMRLPEASVAKKQVSLLREELNALGSSDIDILETEVSTAPLQGIELFNQGRYREALPLLRAHAANSATASYCLAVALRDGLGRAQEDETPTAGDIMYALGKAAEKGNILAMFAFGENLHDGVVHDAHHKEALFEIPALQDEEIGRMWIERAAEEEADKAPLPAAVKWLELHPKK